MVLVMVGVLIWNFSTTFQNRDKTITFSEFVKQLDEGQVQKVHLTGNEILGTSKSGE
jgi:ATP-dependent Zn protease